jgi:hypothetical protein
MFLLLTMFISHFPLLRKVKVTDIKKVSARQQYMPKKFTWGQYLSPITAKGTARVCQKHAGEFACGAPARPFVIHPACLWFAGFVCPHVYCFCQPRAVPFAESVSKAP